jgi:hypothetical protein
MKRLFYVLLSKLLGKNLKSTPAGVIVDQMNEPRPLPMGRKELETWANRIVSGALIPNEDGFRAFHDEDKATTEQVEKLKIFADGQMTAVAEMILHLGPTESHKPDAYFIHALRKGAANQVAHAYYQEKLKERKKKLAEEEAAKENKNEGNKVVEGITARSRTVPAAITNEDPKYC